MSGRIERRKTDRCLQLQSGRRCTFNAERVGAPLSFRIVIFIKTAPLDLALFSGAMRLWRANGFASNPSLQHSAAHLRLFLPPSSLPLALPCRTAPSLGFLPPPTTTETSPQPALRGAGTSLICLLSSVSSFCPGQHECRLQE